MSETDLLTLCLNLNTLPSQELRLEGYFDVYVNVINYQAITQFICAMAIY